ncbi:integral membrane protein TerC [Chloropicon primus]|uniref:Integral membrane protein TerC n=2 Tax=Chloropicon primus TaxID=1764295 RepID=A0A5B8MUA3_9CHLO|nr:integral membrane protein TerC [Chloropicon primus]UPR03107.1 integral membrane protein TerC [Chloropicon primus]|eukprot:QDZ23896.1 integral membrane protein TerC [Chloropicon primus]
MKGAGLERTRRGGAHAKALKAKPTSSFDEVEEGSTEVASGGAEAASISTPGMDYADLAVKVGAAVAFGAFVDLQFGFEKAEAYFTGYILEQTLSVDNLFVFILLFDYFNVPEKGKDRVLSFGIYTAAVLRGVLILLGSELIEKFEPVLLVFAGILLYSAYGVLFDDGGDEDEDLNDSAIVKFCKNFIDVSEDYDGDKFFTVQNGVKVATPLLLVLAVVELSDLIFAVDSIPAVFGVTKDPFIVYTSNMFAIVGLRSLFGVVSTAMARLQYLEKSVGTVLAFVGFKMIADFGGFHITNSQSLLTVCSILGAGVVWSLVAGEAEE